ncbi:unnamed protein product [Penicillium bialowiezense]
MSMGTLGGSKAPSLPLAVNGLRYRSDLEQNKVAQSPAVHNGSNRQNFHQIGAVAQLVARAM